MEGRKQDEPRERCQSIESLPSTSDYSSLCDHGFAGSDQSINNKNKAKTNGHHSLSSTSDEPVTVEIAREISKDIGRDYTKLAWGLGFNDAEVHDIEDSKKDNQEKAYAVIVKFMQKEGSGAKKDKLAFALDKAGRRDIAETLIGDSEFFRKGQDQILIFKVDSYHCSSSSDNSNATLVCEDKDGQLYRVQKLEKCRCNEYRKLNQAVQYPGSTVDFESERHKEFLDLDDLQKQTTELENRFKEIAKRPQLDEEKKKLHEMLILVDELCLVADGACQSQITPDPTEVKRQLYDLCNSVRAEGKNLKQWVITSLDKDVSEEEALQLIKVLEGCLSLQNKMQERIYLGSLKDLNNQPMRERTELIDPTTQRPRLKRPHLPTDPTMQKPKPKESDDSPIPRGSTMPMSGNEQRKLEEKIRPPKDPEEEDDVLLTAL